jgi:hypothetical protein
MGLFLSLSAVIGKDQIHVEQSLARYANSVGGKFQAEPISTDDSERCVIHGRNGNTIVLYPSSYGQWDESSAFLSKDLNAPTFSFHIHDGDLWMYLLYVGGEEVDRFNPVPDYWEKIDNSEVQRWKGDATIVAKYVKGVEQASIDRYLVRWDADETGKAYQEDKFGFEAWQLTDFMSKLGLDYPLDDAGQPKGSTYRLKVKDSRSPRQWKWWKFWE